MTIVENITWLEALVGGAFIGLASAFLLLSNGKIAGISGIVGGLFFTKKGDASWRLMFLIGLIVGGIAINLVLPQNTIATSTPSFARAALAGLIVGIGTSIGSGCTSGHGVCGVSRFSKRSIVATLTFMATGFLTMWLGF